jgi:LAS superfamily LD-carboxypeptidase LdcB
VGGKPTSVAVGHQYLKMKNAASAAGAPLAITSGFRTNAEQVHLYNCYIHHSCNNGNLAARPGYSNHQGGFALDLTTSSWLANNAHRFGFVRTVPSESWHYEYHGPDTGGPCSKAPARR